MPGPPRVPPYGVMRATSSGPTCVAAAERTRCRVRPAPVRGGRWRRPRGCPTRWPDSPITRLVSSPQRRAVQTGGPLADAARTGRRGRRTARRVRPRPRRTTCPIEQIAKENPEELARLASGQLPSAVDETAFLAASGRGRRRPGRRGRSRGHRGGVQPWRGDQRPAAPHPGHRAAAVVPRRLRLGDPAAVLARAASWLSPRSTAPNTYGICCPGNHCSGRQSA